jgi:GntR family transcriptional repressor for pyruvate dehydrogenase complex
MAEELKASRPMIREALQTLNGLGLIETRHGVGSSVARDGRHVLQHPFEILLFLDKVSLEQLFEMREMIEIPAAGLAANRRTDDDLQRLDQLLAEMETPPQGAEGNKIDAHVEFHVSIAAATHNPLTERVLRAVLEARTACLKSLDPPLHDWTNWHPPKVHHANHHAIVEAIRNRDAHAARRAMTMDMQLAARYVAFVRGAVEGTGPAAPVAEW